MWGKPVVGKEVAETERALAPLDGFDAAHGNLIADPSIQFEMQPFVPPEPWFTPDLSWAMQLAPLFRLLFWVVVALIVGWLLYLIVGRLTGLSWRRRARDPEADTPDWRPAEQPARRLLSEADALAAAGRYSEAAHLLLFRSIDEIEQRRPETVRKALTSRDIATLPAVPPRPAEAFGRIVSAVERSLFGGRALGLPDWQACREAYEHFAFAEAWRA